MVGTAVAVVLAAAACANGDDGDADAVPADDQADAAVADDAVADEGAVELVDPYDGHTSEVYGDTAHWICHRDLDDDACVDLTAMVLAPDGSTEPADLAVATDPGVDCFYVYPTVSAHPDTNSTLEPGNKEISTVEAQAAPFATTCRVFAPVYRQITHAGFAEGGFGDEEAGSSPTATWRMRGAPMSPRYVVLPEVLQVSCERSDDHDYLAASLVPDEERDVGALVEEFDGFGIQWGLHLLDANLALGSLLDIVAEQSEAFAGSAA